MGLVIFGAMALYLLISIIAVAWAISHAKKTGKSAKRWGWGAALVMYLIPFWDWIPTVAMHQYYCATEAGFWVYKTPEQWKKENPGVMETLHPNSSVQGTPDGSLYILDERFSIHTHKRQPVPGISTQITNWTLVDQKTGVTLAREITVGSGHGHLATGGGYKFWLSMSPCRSNGISALSSEIEKMRGKK